MSWCRWSTECESGKQSDLYIYDSVHACITVHVAGRRRSNYDQAPAVPSILNFTEPGTDLQDWMKLSKIQREWLEVHTIWEDLPAEYSGKNYDFGYEDLDGLTAFLEKARIDGINFPDYVFDILEESRKEHHDRQI